MPVYVIKHFLGMRLLIVDNLTMNLHKSQTSCLRVKSWVLSFNRPYLPLVGDCIETISSIIFVVDGGGF